MHVDGGANQLHYSHVNTQRIIPSYGCSASINGIRNLIKDRTYCHNPQQKKPKPNQDTATDIFTLINRHNSAKLLA